MMKALLKLVFFVGMAVMIQGSMNEEQPCFSDSDCYNYFCGYEAEARCRRGWCECIPYDNVLAVRV